MTAERPQKEVCMNDRYRGKRGHKRHGRKGR